MIWRARSPPAAATCAASWQGDRVLISGQATTYLRGTVYLR